MVGQRQAERLARNRIDHTAHRAGQREPGAHVRHVEDVPVKQLGDEPLRRPVAHVGEAHGGDVVGVGDDAVGKQGMQRRFDAGRRAVAAQHAARHEAHHVGVAHGGGVAQGRQLREGEAGGPFAPDGAQIGAAAFHQQRVADLHRGVAAARLHQARVAPDEGREVDQLVEVVGAGRRTGRPTLWGNHDGVRCGCGGGAANFRRRGGAPASAGRAAAARGRRPDRRAGRA